MDVLDARTMFTPDHCFLNTATIGLPPTTAVTALRDDLARWATGKSDVRSYDEFANRGRRAFAELVGLQSSDTVAIISQLSQATSVVAAALAPGDEVLVAEGDFTSILFPLLSREPDGINIRSVPLDRFVDSIKPTTKLAAVSAAQSSDGTVIDLDAMAETTADTDTLTFIDTTQAAGWLPIGADRFSVTAASAYKWLCSPRGAGFMTVNQAAMQELRPNAPNWYSAEHPWESTYGAPLRLAESARRFDLSPAWSAWPATAISVELLASIGVNTINTHNVGLANRFRVGLGMGPSNSAIVAFSQEGADAGLTEAGISASSRAGNTRLSFHLYNTSDEVDAALSAIGLA